MKAIFFVVILLFFSGCLSPPASNVPKVCFGERCVLVEIADSPDERSKGLMFRTALVGNAGMLFVFEDASIHGFWMKNTLIPLDGIWINSDGKIVDIITMTPCQSDPCKVYAPVDNASFVLEITGGQAKQWNVRPGDSAQIFGV